MGNAYCCVPQCTSRGSDIPRPSFHRFPSSKEKNSCRREEWITKLKIGKKVSNRMVVCGKHFQASDFYPRSLGPLTRTNLRKNVVPSLNLPITSLHNEELMNKRKNDGLRRFERKEKRERSKENISTLNLEANVDAVEEEMIVPSYGPELSCELHQEVNADVLNEEVIADEVRNLNVTKTDVATQVTSGDLIMPRSFISKLTQNSLNSLTGVHSFELLNTLEKLLEKDYGKLLRRHHMSLKEQIILTLMRIRLDLSFAALCAFFECSPTTCTNIFKDIISHLAVHLKCAIQWLSKENIVRKMPKCFMPYKNTRVVLDCTEAFVSKTNCTKCNIMTYSQYKKGHTVKFLIGVAPSGVITFLSPAYGGRAGDKHIVEESGLLSFLEPHEDSIMVDKGFYIEDLCDSSFIKLIRPPYLKGKSQFSEKEVEVTTRIARARVHVERTIQRVKIFKIFSNKIHWSLLPYINDIATVVVGLANLGSPILAEDKFNL